LYLKNERLQLFYYQFLVRCLKLLPFQSSATIQVIVKAANAFYFKCQGEKILNSFYINYSEDICPVSSVESGKLGISFQMRIQSSGQVTGRGWKC